MATLLIRSREGFVSWRLPAAGGVVDDATCLPAPINRIRVVPCRDGARPSHALIAGPSVRVNVNGSLIVGGLRVLQHKDELTVGAQQMFFSAESVPTVEVFQHDGSARRPRCPVCRAEVRDRQSVVRCPGCSRLYHQIEAASESPAKPCWTYSPACRFCDHPTSMSGEAAWRPDEEE